MTTALSRRAATLLTVAKPLALTVVMTLGLSANAFADFKVAVVDLQKVLHTTSAGKAAQKKFDDLRDKRKAQLEKQDKSLQKREKDLMQTQAELERAAVELQQKGQQPSEELKKKAADFQEAGRKFKQDVMEFDKARGSAADELARKEAELLKPIEDVIKQKVESIAKEQGFSLVLSRQVAVYVANALDITAEVIKRCDGQ